MRKFDTKVQHLKYKVLREVARLAWKDELLENILEIPKTIVQPCVAAYIKRGQSLPTELKSLWAETPRIQT